jgi:DNA-directed RNA polymerase specialized sigma24 family protein
VDRDDDLLRRSSREPGAFGAFYERHERLVLGYFVRRTRNAELAADLAAETFAAALLSARRYRPGAAPASAWLLGIARNVLAGSARRRGSRTERGGGSGCRRWCSTTTRSSGSSGSAPTREWRGCSRG